MTDHTVVFPFIPGDLVMARFGSFPIWPAVVIANCHTSDKNISELGQYKEKGKKYAYVLFMGDRTFGMCSADALKKLSREAAAKSMKTEKKKGKKDAFKDASNYKDYWSLLLEAQLVDPNQEKYELKSIYDLPPGGIKHRIPADSLSSDAEEEEENEQDKDKEDTSVVLNTKALKRARKTSTSASTTSPATKRKRITTPKLKEEDEEDNSTPVIRPEEELETPEGLEKKAYTFRVHLQKGLVQKNRVPTPEEMAEANMYFEELEKFSPKVTKELLKKYKLHKVLKVIGRTDQLQEKAPQYNFRERAQRLVLDWDPMLNELASEKARDTPNTTIDSNTSALKSDTADTTHEETNGTSTVGGGEKPSKKEEAPQKSETINGGSNESGTHAAAKEEGTQLGDVTADPEKVATP